MNVNGSLFAGMDPAIDVISDCTPCAFMQVVKMAKNNNYLYRISVLYCMQDLSMALTPADAAACIVPACLAATADRVANTRFVAARVLQNIAPVVQQHAVQAQVITVLKGLQQDPDPDVKFYAAQSLYVYENAGGGGAMSS
jgi:serine/threonine-protein phosphatase 2A regulatory subunit A